MHLVVVEEKVWLIRHLDESAFVLIGWWHTSFVSKVWAKVPVNAEGRYTFSTSRPVRWCYNVALLTTILSCMSQHGQRGCRMVQPTISRTVHTSWGEMRCARHTLCPCISLMVCLLVQGVQLMVVPVVVIFFLLTPSVVCFILLTIMSMWKGRG
jgi:hypothetical protein